MQALAQPRPRHADLRPMGVLSTLLLAGAGLAAWGWLWLIDAGPDLADAAIAGAPVLLGLYRATCSRDDRRQYVAWLFAAALMLPLLLAMWAGSASAGPAAPSVAMQVAIGIAAACVLLGAWAALLLWTARNSTRIDPAPSIMPDTSAALRGRIDALARAGWPMLVRTGADADVEIRLAVAADGTRWHRVRLSLDTTRREATVREDLGASGARPQDDREADLRAIGDPAFDPTRPEAQRLSARVRQATMIEPALLDALSGSAAVQPDGVALPEGEPAILEAMTPEARGEHMVSLLAAVVTSAGWTWQPVLVDWSGRG